MITISGVTAESTPLTESSRNPYKGNHDVRVLGGRSTTTGLPRDISNYIIDATSASFTVVPQIRSIAVNDLGHVLIICIPSSTDGTDATYIGLVLATKTGACPHIRRGGGYGNSITHEDLCRSTTSDIVSSTSLIAIINEAIPAAFSELVSMSEDSPPTLGLITAVVCRPNDTIGTLDKDLRQVVHDIVTAEGSARALRFNHPKSAITPDIIQREGYRIGVNLEVVSGRNGTDDIRATFSWVRATQEQDYYGAPQREHVVGRGYGVSHDFTTDGQGSSDSILIASFLVSPQIDIANSLREQSPATLWENSRLVDAPNSPWGEFGGKGSDVIDPEMLMSDENFKPIKGFNVRVTIRPDLGMVSNNMLDPTFDSVCLAMLTRIVYQMCGRRDVITNILLNSDQLTTITGVYNPFALTADQAEGHPISWRDKKSGPGKANFMRAVVDELPVICYEVESGMPGSPICGSMFDGGQYAHMRYEMEKVGVPYTHSDEVANALGNPYISATEIIIGETEVVTADATYPSKTSKITFTDRWKIAMNASMDLHNLNDLGLFSLGGDYYGTADDIYRATAQAHDREFFEELSPGVVWTSRGVRFALNLDAMNKLSIMFNQYVGINNIFDIDYSGLSGVAFQEHDSRPRRETYNERPNAQVAPSGWTRNTHRPQPQAQPSSSWGFAGGHGDDHYSDTGDVNMGGYNGGPSGDTVNYTPNAPAIQRSYTNVSTTIGDPVT